MATSAYRPMALLGASISGFSVTRVTEGQDRSAGIPGGTGYGGAGHSHIPDKGNGLGEMDPQAGASFLANNPGALFGLTLETGGVRVWDSSNVRGDHLRGSGRSIGSVCR